MHGTGDKGCIDCFDLFILPFAYANLAMNCSFVIKFKKFITQWSILILMDAFPAA